jgi:hypothetical protein
MVVTRGIKVAIYKYHTNEFVYKNEGVGAMAEQSDQWPIFHAFFPGKIGKIFGKKLAFFLNTNVMINFFKI